MYCKYCGKEIVDGDLDNAVCNSCMTQETANVETEAQPAQNPRMIGFKKALAGTIMSYIGTIYVAYAMIYILFIPILIIEMGMPVVAGALVSLLFMAPAIVVAILSISFGISSIKTFRKVKERKPIATLILGINSLDYGVAMAMLILLILFLMAMLGIVWIYA